MVKNTITYAVSHCCILCALTICLLGCAGHQPAPKHPDDICEIFLGNRQWYNSANDSFRRWGISIPVMMAIMYQESKFEADAKPPRTACLFILPGPRPSSAYGYSQALDETWKWYKQASGNAGADRDNFGDSIDFIGWYCDQSHIRCGISRDDAYNLYLAYHQGHGGFRRKAYQHKAWLRRIADTVRHRAGIYGRQLSLCESKFKRSRSCLWPF